MCELCPWGPPLPGVFRVSHLDGKDANNNPVLITSTGYSKAILFWLLESESSSSCAASAGCTRCLAAHVQKGRLGQLNCKFLLRESMTHSAVGIKRGWREEVTGGGAGSAGGAAQGPLLLADMANMACLTALVVRHSGGWKCAVLNSTSFCSTSSGGED